ncbi:MAG: cbb3-type cytochrome c oxidase subunit I [Gammaproteobacteria bacterium]|nr:MAG: cytochrome C oxidase subunit I [Gammaproteobacteria bacterium]UCH39731.1 MAG: cbb3-type cytochrome c oxidase subunit I [Gammaproteobacteria bacterium]
MLLNQFTLPAPDSNARKFVIGWLLLGVGALLVAGLFTILVVLARTPYFQEIIPWVDFFRTALVVHVDLTVLVWFLAFTGVLWSYTSSRRCQACGWGALGLCYLGTLIIIVSPFTGESYPLMNNYVPVLQNPVFFCGLITFGIGFLLLVIRSCLTTFDNDNRTSGESSLRFGLFVAVVASLFALAALVLSWFGIDEGFEGLAFYDRLFWGSGHIIQFSHTQLMLVAWLWLATVSGAPLRISPRVTLFLFILGLQPVLAAPVIYIAFDVSSGDHLFWFIQLMKYGGAIAAVPIGLAVTLAALEKWRPATGFEIERNALLFSILLFGVGGIIGFMIEGSTVTVPAHYHGSIVGITLAFMGLTYHLLPQLGFARVEGRAARWQPGIYGSGQLMHIIGLAWSGGYNVARKSTEVERGLEQTMGLGLMGLGGAVSIVGGIMFLVLVYLSLTRRGAN